MLKKTTLKTLFTLLFGVCAGYGYGQAPVNIFRGTEIHVSSENPDFPGRNAVDGVFFRGSTWMPIDASRPPHVLEVTLPHYYDLDSVVLYTGIPETEKNDNEKNQAAGFWSVKNFKLQYWDDANWTDIPGTEITENRKDRLSFAFRPAITTFRFRLWSVDGEPIRIIEFEGYGSVNGNLAAPNPPARTETGFNVNRDTRITGRIGTETVGKSMKYVGYNQGYYMPGSNVSSWLEYSNVNSLRVWTDLRTYSPERWVEFSPEVSTLEAFESRKSALRADPGSGPFIALDSIAWQAGRPVYSTNTMVFEYALDELKRLGIEVLLQINHRDFEENWPDKWRQWQRFYGLAFYAARRGDVSMFAMQNEPNHAHSGPMTLDTYISAMRLVSDAVHCAVEDVNRIYGKQLIPRFIGPVTAGTNTNWWAAVAAAERVDYRGEKTDRDLIDIFSTHSYNLPAAGYANKVRGIDRILTENHPEGVGKPIVFTEIGRWMNAYLIDKEETMDSPSLFTEWAGIYTNNMLNGGYGMWAFKFANTVSETYLRGIKSGHHHIWKGHRFVEDAYVNLALGKPVTASGQQAGYPASRITDGNKADGSSWRFTGDGPKWVEIDLGGETVLGGAAVYTGSSAGEFTGTDRLKQVQLEAYSGGRWTPIPGTKETNAKYVQLIYLFGTPVTASKLRFTTEDPGEAIVREIKLFGPEVSRAEVSFDVGGSQRTAQVVRLFAKGFRDERPLLACDLSVDDPDLDFCAAKDPATGNVYVWLVQRNPFDYQLSLDLSALGIPASLPVVMETVSGTSYGEASVLYSDGSGKVAVDIPGQSVSLLTVFPQARLRAIPAAANATVRGGELRHRKAETRDLSVALNAGEPSGNAVTYIDFQVDRSALESSGRVLFSVASQTGDGDGLYRYHVYLRPAEKGWNEKQLRWSDAPDLDPEEALVLHAGTETFFAGELVSDPTPERHELDVTEVVKRHPAEHLTFILVRETREPGDDRDKGRSVSVAPRGTPDEPLLKIW